MLRNGTYRMRAYLSGFLSGLCSPDFGTVPQTFHKWLNLINAEGLAA